MKLKKGIVIGGANGIGLAVAIELCELCEKVVIVDRAKPTFSLPSNSILVQENLIGSDFSFLTQIENVDIVFYSAGFGRVAPFETFIHKEIDNYFAVNSIAPIKVISHFSKSLLNKKNFYMGVMVSIAGHVSSPLFALYGASKAALRSEIESVNIELEKAGTDNRILDISPGSLKGTAFNGNKQTDVKLLQPLAKEIINQMLRHEVLFIPQYEEVFKKVIQRYKENPQKFGLQSYEYKSETGRMSERPRIKVGYLSGTFDLFHIGHLNLLKRAKEQCDFLVVGIHKDASHKGKQTFIPFEERKAILESIRYVDRVIESEKEDCDVYLKGKVKYDILFVGSDYKGTPRFQRYEELFADKDVSIVYFPYTQGTSSTQLREAISK